MNKTLLICLIATMLFLAGCNLTINLPGNPTNTPGGPAPTPTSSSPYAWPNESGSCILTTSPSQTAYDRPSLEANVFGETGDGFTREVSLRTFDGWVGFDPGVAQAANIGIFRYRWLHFDQVSLSGGCTSVPEATWVPHPNLCYDMPMETVQVHSGANTSTEVIATLEVEDFAAVVGLTDSGWAQLNLGEGNTGLTGIGWVEQFTLNMNGTLCDELPMVNP